MPAPMLGREGQVHERANRTVGAQQRVTQLEEGIAPASREAYSSVRNAVTAVNASG